MTLQFEAEALGDFVLTLFNLAIDEFLNGTALQADQMIMVVAIIQLKSGIVCVKMVTNQNSRRFELRQHAVNSCKADIHVFSEQGFVNVVRRHVPLSLKRSFLENFQNLHPGTGCLQPRVLQLGRLITRCVFHILKPRYKEAFAFMIRVYLKQGIAI